MELKRIPKTDRPILTSLLHDRPHLETVADVRSEMINVYHEQRCGVITANEAKWLINSLRWVLETMKVELAQKVIDDERAAPFSGMSITLKLDGEGNRMGFSERYLKTRDDFHNVTGSAKEVAEKRPLRIISDESADPESE